MKKTLLILVLILFNSCYTIERNCADFKTGTFIFSQKINGKTQTATFVRTENRQIETYLGKTDTATVRWVNDCEYVLQKMNPKNREEKKAIAMKILTTNKNSYTFEYNFVGETTKQKGTVTKIK